MLEPLIVLTVINCLFMFSSTLTTCALWWQYRSNHSCCKKKAAYEVRKPKEAKPKRNSHATKQAGKSELGTLFSVVSSDKLNTTTDNETNSKKCEKKKSKTKLKYLSQFSQHVEPRPVANVERSDNPEDNIKRFANQIKPGFVMEFSTMQKVVQILDKDVDTATTNPVFRDSPRKYMQKN